VAGGFVYCWAGEDVDEKVRTVHVLEMWLHGHDKTTLRSRKVLTLQAPRSLSISHFLVKKNKFCPRLGAPVRHTTVPVPAVCRDVAHA
jgi:hypothetical protein